MNKRFRASYKIAIGFAVIALLAVYGQRYVNDFMLGRDKFPQLQPGDVNLVGVDTAAGYGVLIQNRVAKLVMGKGGSFGPGEMSEKSLDSSSSSDRKFIPIKDMLKGLQSDVPGISYFVERLNDITDEMLPPDAPIWPIEDIEKALEGDKPLQARLVRDVNMNLDGTPLDHVSKDALFNGILIDVPVPLKIKSGGVEKTVVARVKRPFRASFIALVEGRVSKKFADNETIRNEYVAALSQLKSGELQKEEIPKRLRSYKDDVERLALLPQRVLDSVEPVINEDQITGASYATNVTPKGNTYTLVITLNDEGRKRLWQFTRDHVNDQILVTVNGVAIAAPRVDHSISGGEFLISGLEDESLVQDAVDTIKKKRATTTK